MSATLRERRNLTDGYPVEVASQQEFVSHPLWAPQVHDLGPGMHSGSWLPLAF